MRKMSFASAMVMAIVLSLSSVAQESSGPFRLQPLPYEYNALEPSIDAQTMEIHHGKHLAAYVNNLNAAIRGTEAEKMSLEQILANTARFDVKVRNNAGGVYNHNLFFSTLSPRGGGMPATNFTLAVQDEFGSFQDMQKKLYDAAMSRFGSGWAWLYVTPAGKVAICSTPNQDNPLMDIAEYKGIPILGIDVWEHAYYLKYQNRRGDYLNALWNVIDWMEVARRYDEAILSLNK